MARLESIDDSNWKDFIAAPRAVLLLANRHCPACRAWSEELASSLEKTGDSWGSVRFGKLLLDGEGVEDFKRTCDWLEMVEGVPFNVLYVDGVPRSSFYGTGLDRLSRRLERLRQG